MAQFFDAQNRFKQGTLLTKNPYLRDVLQTYGDGGRRIQLPDTSPADFQKALNIRRQERAHYQSIMDESQALRASLEQQRVDNAYLRGMLQEFRSMGLEEDAADGGGGGGGEPSGDGVDHVLPAARDTGKANASSRKKQVTISSTKAVDESTDNRSSGSGGDSADALSNAAATVDGGEDDGSVSAAEGENTSGPAAGDAVQE